MKRILKKTIGAGTFVRPRLIIKFSNKHVYIQCINDSIGITMFSLTTNIKPLKLFKFNNCLILSKYLGIFVGKELIRRSIHRIKFDRSVKKYHGNIKIFLESIRLYINV